PYVGEDRALAVELSDRAGTFLDNARLYAREREGALMLQRSLLPQHIHEPPGVSLAYRYVPGSSGTEVGGDWFDVIPLPGGRVAFVVGDVMGHGLHSAVTMGRLRT
ncbi:PP2C family protein-serine/threonine phosphatase, partial [Streptomyces sp. GSL17-113]